jgi:peptide/nickel transport system substrate-binding protein
MLLTALCLGPSACAPSASTKDVDTDATKAAATKTTEPAGEASKADLDAPLLEPFDPPSLAELEASVEWFDQPVEDGIENLRTRQAGEAVLATVSEALALRSTSPENNAKILSAMGRLPANDAEIDYDATLNRLMRAEVNTTNPLKYSTVYDGYVTGLLYSGLFSFDWNFRPFASKDTVVSWQASKDRMYDKVVLRDDLTWSDGKPFTAHDVAFSFRTILNPKVPIPAVRAGTDKLRWVEAYDDRTVVFFHKESLATSVWNVNFPIIAKHVYESSLEEDPTLETSDYHVRLEDHPIGSGPYTLVRHDKGQEILLERRESWYLHNGKQVRDKPYFKEIRFRIIPDSNSMLLALKKGQIDEADLTPEQWVTQTDGADFYGNCTKAYGLEWVYFYIGWNMNTRFFDDVRVRRAMSFALDYNEMLKNICYGLYEPCSGPFHPASWMASKNAKPYHQDLDQAEALLAEAGWEDHDGDGILDKEIEGRSVPFEFSLLVNNSNPTHARIAAVLKENLESIGVLCNIRLIEFATLVTTVQERKFEAVLGGWGTGADPDTSDNIWTTEAIRNGRNYVGFSDPRVDELFDLGKREFDRDRRAAIYAEIHDRVYEAQPYTFLYYRSSFYGFNKRLRGYNFSPRGPDGYSPGYGSLWIPAY